MKKNKIFSTSGITLITLIVTIIVLIILASITLYMTLSDDGIIRKALRSKEEIQNEINDQQGTAGDIYNNLINEHGLLPVIVPEGFTLSENTGVTIEEGIVIVDRDGNEFVWVPVKTPVLDLSHLATETDRKITLESQIAQGIYPMAVKLQDGNYIGVLYEFSLDTSITPNKVKIQLLSTTQPEYREPDILTDSTDGDAAVTTGKEIKGIKLLTDVVGIIGKDNQEILDNWDKQLKDDFNDMVEKVKNRGGFWVGRYETSLATNTIDGVEMQVVQSKPNQLPMTSEINSANTWYGIYKLQRENYKSAKSVTSAMIWGSQWDQMAIWMKEVRNVNSTSRHFYILDGSKMGWYNDNYLSGNPAHKTGIPVDNNVSNRVRNIYDLSGNMYSWTQEVNSTNSRVVRGGNYTNRSTSYVVGNRWYTFPYMKGDSYGSRLVLY